MQWLAALDSPVIPVVVLDDPADAVPLARACLTGGINALEITLRTSAGLESIRRIAAEVPQAWVGAGTVTTVDELFAAQSAGARFAFSPGFSLDLVKAARDLTLDYVPGVLTPSEAMAAQNAGCRLLKFFPAQSSGGVATLKALHGPFPNLRFCPTGGIDAARAASYLALPNVAAVGGSWVTPASAISARDWGQITRLAQATHGLR